ncbi:MAG: hypothetical protein B7Z37_23495 [Verrucomicrobia bacterium 12-59-8]|nr:MAG: hypothetical protein B7Z37_23495 [Verrucomicrobia bacterium 12-59-8]
MLPNPSYATDPQLRQMAQGGLPGAINEEITRLAMRRGARVNPQAQAPMPQPKMSPEEMIADLVSRVRGKNAQAAQSIVPAGTPMQQPRQPPQQAPQGIKAFHTGGVNISYGRDPEKDARFQGRTQSFRIRMRLRRYLRGRRNFRIGMSSTLCLLLGAKGNRPRKTYRHSTSRCRTLGLGHRLLAGLRPQLALTMFPASNLRPARRMRPLAL